MKRHAIAGAILLFCQVSHLCADDIIYADDFSGLAAADLNGQAPDTGGGTWTGTNQFNADGSVVSGAGSVTLPFLPESGKIYTLSATIALTNNDANWVGLGFGDAAATWAGSNPAQSTAVRFSNASLPGYSWMITARTTGQSGFGGSRTANTASETGFTDVLNTTVTLKIVLDTTAANWQTSYFVNNVPLGTTTHVGAQPIDVVGFTSTTGAAGQITNFQLSSASTPDPDTDADGLPDAWELAHTTPPSATALAPGDDLENAGAGDGLTNLQEYQSGTNPNNPDSDGDLLIDGPEKAGVGLRPPTNPAQADTDGDGLNDKAESNTGSFLSASDTGSDPTKRDTDNDGSKDGMEVNAGKNPNDPLSRLIRIMAIGDSITAGYTDNPGWANHPFMFGYRGPLYTRLTAAGYPFQFVGSSPEPWDGTSGDPTRGGAYTPALDLRTFDQDHHRGYGGIQIPAVQNSIAAWLTADKPDVILLLIGINGIGTGSPALLDTLVNTIVTNSPNAHLILAQITPRNPYNTDLWNYNVYIRDTLVPTYAGNGAKITTVDLYSLFLTNPADPTGIAPGVLANNINHPTNALYDAMAGAWFAGIEALGLNEDADNDGLPDSFELANTTPPSATALVPSADIESDGLTNLQEYQNGTNPNDADSDDDTLPDGPELTGAGQRPPTNPVNADTDADTLGDGVETNTGVFVSLGNTGTNPTQKDTDGDGALDAVEIAGPFTNPNDANSYPPVPLVGLWRFEGDAADSSGNANHGSLENGAGVTNDAPEVLGSGRCLLLSGAAQQYVIVPHSASLDMASRMTVAAWVKVAGTSWDGILAKNPSDGSLNNHAGNYEFRIANATRKVNFGYQRGGANDSTLAATAGAVADQTWTHLAMTVDGTTAKFYRNGVLEETLPLVAGFGATNTSPLYIGTRADFFTSFDGCLDDVALFSGVLGPVQIAEIMNGDFSDFGVVNEAPLNFTGIVVNPSIPSVTLTFNSRPGRTYVVEYSTALAPAGQPGGWIELSNSLAAQGGSTTYVDTVAAGSGPRVFYRVREKP
jgi:hypothetical protein